MGGWKLEASRYLILVGFPVVSFWAFNQPGFFDAVMRGYKLPEPKESSEQMRVWKESLMEEKRRKDYEKFLREQMEFEEAKKLREQNRI